MVYVLTTSVHTACALMANMHKVYMILVPIAKISTSYISTVYMHMANMSVVAYGVHAYGIQYSVYVCV
jgi:hypothetical protein